MKRWQIITYSRDSGTDEKLDYTTLLNAKCIAREYRRDHDGVIVYDKFLGRISSKSGYWPEGSLPLEA